MKVLVVDDSPFMSGIIKLALESGGYEAVVVEPESLFEILQAVHREKPDLVLTDLKMPKCDGETLIRTLRERSDLKDLPILVLTAHHSEALVEHLRQWKLLGILAKPLSPQAILEGVRAVFPLR